MKYLAAALLLSLATPALGQTTNAPTIPGSVVISGSAFQEVLPAVGEPPAMRRSLTIQNNNTLDNCWLFLGPTSAATKSNSMLLTPGQGYTRFYPYVPGDAIQAACASGDTLYIDTQ
jgi:hypothetical protein